MESGLTYNTEITTRGTFNEGKTPHPTNSNKNVEVKLIINPNTSEDCDTDHRLMLNHRYLFGIKLAIYYKKYINIINI